MMAHGFRLSVLALIVSAALPTDAFAWGSIAHRLIADLAYARLTPNAELEVQRILSTGAELNLPSCKFGTFEDAAVWPDCVRGHNVRAFRDLRPLHYEDRPLCGAAPKSEYCRDGECITSAISNARAVLLTRNASQKDKAIALAELIHFVGDLHQPLHMTDNNDRGGNEVSAFFPNHRALTNLHAVWDDALVKSVVGSRGQRSEGVSERIRLHANEWRAGQIEDWADESHRLAVQYAYGALPVRQVCGSPSTAPENLDSRYVDRATPVVEAQLGKAAVRLAQLLNSIFR